jgi:hypothetical protein
MDVSPRAKAAGTNKFGTRWLKALYRGYTNESFSEYDEQPAWQGTQGPTIRSEVGDLIEIMFVNKMSANYATMHSMGLAYSKDNEGADYPNNTMPGASNQLPESGAVPPIDAGVEPSGCVVYKWLANDASGPDDGSPAKTHSYHSYVSLQEDSSAGLIGPSIVYHRGQMAKVMSEYREISLLYMIFNEALSFLSGANAVALTNGTAPNATAQSIRSSSMSNSFPEGNYSIWHPQLVNFEGANQFSAAPSFYTMNGYVFANNPTFDMCLGDKVIWYVNAYGAASHVFHMHGNGFSFRRANDYSISLNDGVGKTLVMDATGRGMWQVICHVDNHHAKGMVANYRVYSAAQCPLPVYRDSS